MHVCTHTERYTQRYTHAHSHTTDSLFPETEQAIHKRLGNRADGRADEWTNGQVYATVLSHRFWIGLMGFGNEMNEGYAEQIG